MRFSLGMVYHLRYANLNGNPFHLTGGPRTQRERSATGVGHENAVDPVHSRSAQPLAPALTDKKRRAPEKTIPSSPQIPSTDREYHRVPCTEWIDLVPVESSVSRVGEDEPDGDLQSIPERSIVRVGVPVPG